MHNKFYKTFTDRDHV